MQDAMNEETTSQADLSAKKLTDWEKEPTLQELKGDLEQASPVHSTQAAKIRTWLENLNIEGSAKMDTPKGSSAVQPKLIRKQAEWRYASLSEPFLNTEDVFNVTPKTWRDVKAAQQNAMVLNHQFNTQIDKVDFVDDFVRAAVDEGTAIIRVGWDFEEQEYEEEEPIVEFVEDPSVQPMLDHLAQMQAESPEEFEQVDDEHRQALELSVEHGVPLAPRVTGTQTVTKTRTLRNRPTLDLCHYDDVIVDPTCLGKIEKAGFVVYRFASSLSELKKDGKYQNLDNINLQTNNILGEPDDGPDNEGSFNFTDKARQKFTVHEYWGYRDIDGSGVVRPIVAAWVGNTLIRLEENPFPDQKPPFVVARYLPVRRSLYGEPDGSLLVDNQKIIGAVTRGMIDLLGRSANGQTGMRKDMLDVTNRRRFQKGQDYEFNAGVDPRQGVFQHTYPEIPASAQYMVESQNQEAESLTGVKAFNQGMSGEALGNTATGVRGVLDASSKREVTILRRLARAMVEVGRKIIAMNGVFLDETEVVRITDEEFVQVKRDDLAGNFDLKLTISTAEEDEAKAQELSFMLQTMGNNMDSAFSRMILADIARLRKMPELAKRIESYEPQPDPLEQQRQMLEIRKLEAEIAKIQSETVENYAGAEYDRARAGTAEAESDVKSLDFVERESGVTQEREIQKIGAQAESQIKLKKAEARLQGGQDRQSRVKSAINS